VLDWLLRFVLLVAVVAYVAYRLWFSSDEDDVVDEHARRRVDALELMIDQLGARVRTIGGTLDSRAQRDEHLPGRIDRLQTTVADLERRIGDLERRI
jgi:hypothetical protein